jgi:RNA polymerase sigma-70 factor (ECF subfamily)
MSVVGGEAAPDAATDASIVARVAEGDLAAEDAFVRKYQRGVRVLVRRHCRPNDPIAEDLVQDVLTRVLERLRAGAIRDASALPSYVQATVAHATSAEFRSRRSIEASETLDQIAGDDAPEAQLSASQLRQLVATLLERLPVPRDREVLSRFYLQEQDKADVCRALGIDSEHFHRVVHRARGRFRDMLFEAGIRSS